jgi:signal peptidase I
MSTARTIIQPLAIALVLAAIVRASSIGFYSIPSSSMEPTLRVGDTVVVTPYFAKNHPSRGDVVVFRSPSSAGEMVVKRIVAVPGDLIESRDGRLLIGGHAVPEPYSRGTTAAVAPQIIAGGTYYLLGDNRTNSYDSRLWGSIQESAIVGRARLVLWSGAIAPRANASAVTSDAPPASHGLRLFKLIR